MKRFIISPKLNLSLYTLLLIITPLHFCRTIYQCNWIIDSSGFNVGTVLIPYTVILVLQLQLRLSLLHGNILTWIFGIFIFVVMLFVGQLMQAILF